MVDGQGERVRRDIVRLCHSGLDATTLRRRIVQRLRAVIPIDASFFATVDPGTLLFTSAVADDELTRLTAPFLANEFLEDDANQFVQLARRSEHVGTLQRSTCGALHESARYRSILAPMHLGDELRAALVVDGKCWGVMCLHRERSRIPYSAAEILYLARLGPHIAEGLRAAIVIDEATSVTSAEGPGLVLLADDLSQIACTPAGERWLEEMETRDERVAGGLPRAVTAVAARLLALERGDKCSVELPPRVRVHTGNGHWAVLHASRLSGSTPLDQIAVIVEEALPADIVPVVLMAYALSARESEVSSLVLRGHSTKEIAASLHISADTVQDHLKSVFDKTGVRSRRELVAAIFGRHNLPAMQAGLPLSSHGGFRSG